MLSNCALAAVASTSRLLCARRTLTTLVSGSDSADHEPAVLPVPTPFPKTSETPTRPTYAQARRRMKAIFYMVDSKSPLSDKQKEWLDALGLVSPTVQSPVSRHLDVNQLNTLREFFASYLKGVDEGKPPQLKGKLKKALSGAVARAFGPSDAGEGEPSAAVQPAKVVEAVAERRGRIKPTVAVHRIRYDVPDALSPLANSQLHSRSRYDLMPLKEDVLTDIKPVNEMRPISRLAHGLDRTLFNPGVNWLQDPRSRVFNYDPWLQKIPSVRDFAFERLPGFIKSSRDEDLWNLCRREGRQFAGSTSSLSGLLCHIYFLLSRDRPVDLSTLSKHMNAFPETFTPGQRMPASVILRHKEGVYATDSDSFMPGSSETNVLSWMGTMLEKFLTTDAATFSRYMRDSPDPAEADTDTRREAYRYSMSSKMVMRSQLDAVDPRLPGSGVFDIKTRAAMSVRYDSKNWVENAGYLIRRLHGVTESFEREYCDLIRSAFLKYSFQARIGAMDGVMVTYHNTARVFGFQYIPLEEMEARLYGAPERGERIFAKCVQVLELLLQTATGAFPGKSVRILTEKYELDGFLRFWVEPVADEEADAQITANEEAEHEEAIQLSEGVDPNEIVSRRIQKAKQAADAEEKKKSPIKMFDLHISHLLNGKYVTAEDAINKVAQEWGLKVTVERPALEEGELRKLRAEARRRQFRANFLPSGVSLDQMAKRWDKEAKINPAHEGAVPAFNPAHWTKADWKTQAVRRLSRRGAEETKRLDKLDKEMGHENLVPEWVQASGVSLPEPKREPEPEFNAEKSKPENIADRDVESGEPGESTAEPSTASSTEQPREARLASATISHARKARKLGSLFGDPTGEPLPVPEAVREQMAKSQQVLEQLEALVSTVLEEGGGRVPAAGAEKVTERMHEMPHALEGEARTHEWDERDNLHRVDTEMDKGMRPSSSHESSVKEWKTEGSDKPLPGTKAAKDEEKA